MKQRKKFIPALGFKQLTPFFEPLMKILGPNNNLQKTILDQANIKNNQVILDFGCGSGTLMIMAQERAPKSIIHGLDIDPQILQIAKKKMNHKGYHMVLKNYYGFALPYKNEKFDKVISSLVFHHLNREEKIRSLQEIYRILKVGGQLHILDFGPAHNIISRILFLAVQALDGFENTQDNVQGLLPIIIQSAGFNQVTEQKQIATPVGTISLYSAIKSQTKTL